MGVLKIKLANSMFDELQCYFNRVEGGGEESMRWAIGVLAIAIDARDENEALVLTRKGRVVKKINMPPHPTSKPQKPDPKPRRRLELVIDNTKLKEDR